MIKDGQAKSSPSFLPKDKQRSLGMRVGWGLQDCINWVPGLYLFTVNILTPL